MPRRLGAAVVAATLLLLASCDAAPDRAPDAARPIPGGTLTVAVRELGSLDPLAASWRGSVGVLAQIYEPLTRVDPITQQAIPGAARWDVSADGLRWRFRIRKDARFSDGKPVTARDFKFAFDRIARRSSRSDVAFILAPVRGYRDIHDAGTAPSLAGVTVRRADILDISLERPFADLAYALAHPRLAPLETSRYTRSVTSLKTSPVGNGPFRVSASSAQEVVLTRNESFGGASALLDSIVFHKYATAEDGWRAFTRGAALVAEIPPGELAPKDVTDAAGDAPLWSVLSFGPNQRQAKYQKPEVRRALSLAIDRVAIARTVYADTKTPATGLIPRGMRGFVPNACGACTHDPDRARRLLRAAFRSNPPVIVVDHLAERTSRLVAEAIADDLRAVGLKASTRAHGRDAYLRTLQSGKADLAQLGWLSDVATPDGFLAEQLGSSSPNNLTGSKDPAFDTLIDRARRAGVESSRIAFYRRAEARALDLMPLIPVVFFRQRVAVDDRIRAFRLDGSGVFDGARVWFARA